jgi:hypothetical protein
MAILTFKTIEESFTSDGELIPEYRDVICTPVLLEDNF